MSFYKVSTSLPKLTPARTHWRTLVAPLLAIHLIDFPRIFAMEMAPLIGPRIERGIPISEDLDEEKVDFVPCLEHSIDLSSDPQSIVAKFVLSPLNPDSPGDRALKEACLAHDNTFPKNLMEMIRAYEGVFLISLCF